MRRKLICIAFVMLMVLGLLPVVAFADPGEYNANDLARIKAFLEQPSAEAGKTNAEQLGFDVDDPSTWIDIWNDDAPKRVSYIRWNDQSLAGTLNLAGCEKLGVLRFQQNAITSLVISGCVELTDLDCSKNSIETLSVSDSINLQYFLCSDNKISMLDLSANTELRVLGCANNKIDTLDLKSNPLIDELYCENNKLTSLDLSAQTDIWVLECGNNMITSLSPKAEFIERLYCENNKLTSLDLSAVTAIRELNCKNNALTAMDLSKYDDIRELDVTGNKLTSLKAVIDDKNIELKADGAGYVGLAYKVTKSKVFSVDDSMLPMAIKPQIGFFYAEAVPEAPSTFKRWMDADAKEVSKAAKIDLTPGQSYALTAKFLPPLALESSVPSGKIFTSGRITLTPNIPGGTWTWDESFFTATFNSPATFTALKSGTSRVTYTAEGISTHYDITVLPPLQLSSSVSGGNIYTSGRLTLTPNIPGGTWTWDQAMLSAVISGDSAVFTALKSGTSRVTYTAEGVSAHYDITAIVAEMPATGQDYTWFYVLGGLAIGALILAGLVYRRKARI